MKEIKLKVTDDKLDTLMGILDNLKDGLISEIHINGKSPKLRTTQYQPKTNAIVREENSGTNDTSGKYINPATYKQKLKKR